MNKMTRELRRSVRSVCALVLALSASWSLTGCDEDAANSPFEEERLKTYIEYLENDTKGEYSEWLKLLETSEFYGMLAARGDYTFLACKNETMQAFYADKGVSGIDGLEKDYVDLLVKTHTVMSKYQSFSFNQGPLSDTTMNGNFLTVKFGQDGLNGLVINGESKVVERDVECSNGFLHTLDRPIEPIGDGIYNTLRAQGEYTILTEAMEKTGLADTLELLTNDNGVRVVYTVFAEKDEVFKAKGIADFTALVAELGAGDDYESPKNKLHSFVRHHIFSGKRYSSALETDILLTVGNTMVKLLKNQEGYFINSKVDDFGLDITEGANSLDLFSLDLQSKNGVVHDMKDVLFEEDIQPITVQDNITDVPELFGKRTSGNDQDVIYTKDIARWRSKGYDQFVYMYQGGNDQLNCYTATAGWFEFETRPILKGKYEITSNFGAGWAVIGCTLEVWVDGVRTDNLIYPGTRNGLIGTYVFEENGPHVIKFKSVSGGRLNVDKITFKPVK
ncbi:hypothetical protein FUAX_15280 [Fulvitalea axinellae]|uniref:FAS1 domain-containing protein n=1 Tax=Fulvitalea axinellae TaxID=1182444 RepID=A0AAU9CAB6_9BACT|nr:hypothetical protein FUAX_15280 [Fulvitalea axinellae]